jgi:hypothetical protein
MGYSVMDIIERVWLFSVSILKELLDFSPDD